jgi:ABC-type multidrug transport system fused ATPase/permease subunit
VSNNDDRDRYNGVLHALGEMATELRQHKERVMATVTLVANEFVRQQHLFDQFVAEQKAERAGDAAGRDAARKRADRFRWATIIAIVLLIVINLLMLAFFIGRVR